jgi:hypothetical protein
MSQWQRLALNGQRAVEMMRLEGGEPLTRDRFNHEVIQAFERKTAEWDESAKELTRFTLWEELASVEDKIQGVDQAQQGALRWYALKTFLPELPP